MNLLTKRVKRLKLNDRFDFPNTFKFMSSSLAKLVENVKRDDFKHLRKYYLDKQLDLLLRKGVFSNEYFNDQSMLDETSLSSKENFYSSLTEKGISNEDYTCTRYVWQAFNMKTFKDYHNLYMKVDVLQLTDVFENFRDIYLKQYQLDPAWYYIAPGLSWDAMLKTTELELDPITDVEKLLFFEKEIRGGVSMTGSSN